MVSLKTTDWVLDNVETVLFDKDGTFIDLHYFWGKMTELRALEIINHFALPENVFENLCNYLGYDVTSGKMLPDGITALYSRSKIIEIFKGNLQDLGVVTTDTELAEIFDFVSQIFYKDMQKYTKPIDDAVEFIKDLRARGLRLGVVTSDSVESTYLTLKYFGWEELFDVVVGRESSVQTKESGALTMIALTQLAVNPLTTVMIGDAPMDYYAAKNAGVERIILVATGQILPEELQKTSPYVLKSLKEISIE